MKKTQKRLSVTIELELYTLLENSNFNKSKLINNLLKDYLDKTSIVYNEDRT